MNAHRAMQRVRRDELRYCKMLLRYQASTLEARLVRLTSLLSLEIVSVFPNPVYTG